MNKLESEIKSLKWNHEHLKLQVHDALEETKDWEQLRVTNHLRQVTEGKIVSDEKALANSLDKLAIAEDIQKSQLLMYERETERLASQIQSTEAENQLLKRQIEDTKAKITKSKEECSSILEVCN